MKIQQLRRNAQGFTLIELMVVMLIVTILTLAIWPTIQEQLNKAVLTANAKPLCGAIQVKAELYDYDKGHLPGLLMMADGRTPANPPGNSAIDTITSMVQTFYKDTNDVNIVKYENGGYEIGGVTAISVKENGNGANAQHFGSCLDVDWESGTTAKAHPSHIQYVAPLGGYQTGDRYYAIGVFGDGDGIKAGIGFAILHIVNTTLNQKIVAYWERSKVKANGQLRFMVAGTENDISPDKDENYVYLPPATTVSTEDSENWAGLVKDLANAGWVF